MHANADTDGESDCDADRSCDTYSYGKPHTERAAIYTDADSYIYGDGNTDRDGDSNSYAYFDTETFTDAKSSRQRPGRVLRRHHARNCR